MQAKFQTIRDLLANGDDSRDQHPERVTFTQLGAYGMAIMLDDCEELLGKLPDFCYTLNRRTPKANDDPPPDVNISNELFELSRRTKAVIDVMSLVEDQRPTICSWSSV